MPVTAAGIADHHARARIGPLRGWAPCEDGREDPDPGWFDTGLAHARTVLAQPDRVLFTHCQGGRGAGPSMGYAVMLDRGAEPAPAYAAINLSPPGSLLQYAPQALDHHLMTANASPESAAAVPSWLRRSPAGSASLTGPPGQRGRVRARNPLGGLARGQRRRSETTNAAPEATAVTLSTAGQAPIFFASGWDPAKAAR